MQHEQRVSEPVSRYFNSHTPRGVQQIHRSVSGANRNFNSHTPRGVQLCWLFVRHRIGDFNSHTPRGVQLQNVSLYYALWISTHTPLAGCNQNHTRPKNLGLHFNSHTPRGVQLVGGGCCMSVYHFNSHTPRGVQPTEKIPGVRLIAPISTHTPLAGCNKAVYKFSGASPEFQLTHPSRGATNTQPAKGDLHFYFNSHTPRGVQLDWTAFRKRVAISTHTPLAGCNTPCVGVIVFGWKISTHTPLAGCNWVRKRRLLF